MDGLDYTGTNLDPNDLAELVEATLDRFGRIDGMVNCTRHGSKGGIGEISDEDWHLGLDYYLTNMIRMARPVTLVMTKQRSENIAHISTLAAFEPDPDISTSAVFQAGLASYEKLCSTKHAPSGIRMSNVLPGSFDNLPEKKD